MVSSSLTWKIFSNDGEFNEFLQNSVPGSLADAFLQGCVLAFTALRRDTVQPHAPRGPEPTQPRWPAKAAQTANHPTTGEKHPVRKDPEAARRGFATRCARRERSAAAQEANRAFKRRVDRRARRARTHVACENPPTATLSRQPAPTPTPARVTLSVPAHEPAPAPARVTTPLPAHEPAPEPTPTPGCGVGPFLDEFTEQSDEVTARAVRALFARVDARRAAAKLLAALVLQRRWRARQAAHQRSAIATFVWGPLPPSKVVPRLSAVAEAFVPESPAPPPTPATPTPTPAPSVAGFRVDPGGKQRAWARRAWPGMLGRKREPLPREAPSVLERTTPVSSQLIAPLQPVLTSAPAADEDCSTRSVPDKPVEWEF
jgi:hypothetical protein